MKNKIIALISALSLMIPMALTPVASAKTEPQAAGLTAVYNAAKSTTTEAVYDVYLTGYGDKTLTTMNIYFAVNADVVNTTTLRSEATSRITTSSSAGAAGILASYNWRNKLVAAAASSLNDISWTESQPIMTVKLPLKAAVSEKTSAITASDKISLEVNGVIESGTASSVYTNAIVDQILPMSATVAGTTISEDAASDAATYFKVENAPLAGTAYWYADFAGTAKKLAANVPNTVGTADLGFVYTGADAPTSVKIVCE